MNGSEMMGRTLNGWCFLVRGGRDCTDRTPVWSCRMTGQESSKALTIRELPRSERPRERLIDLGAGALSSAELLAILLGSGGAGRSALQVGQSVLAEAGGALRRIARQPVAALTAVSGVGLARAVTIH